MALAFAFAMPAAAQDGLLKKYDRRLTTPRNYVCYRTTEKMKIDGKLNEKVWQKAAQTESFVDISGFDFPEAYLRHQGASALGRRVSLHLCRARGAEHRG